MDDYQEIACVIKGARCARNLSKAALARQLQVRANTTAVTGKVISRWERGARIPSPFWRSHLACTLDVAREELDHAAKVARRNRRRRRPQQQ